jgi:hypothetical protein
LNCVIRKKKLDGVTSAIIDGEFAAGDMRDNFIEFPVSAIKPKGFSVSQIKKIDSCWLLDVSYTRK